MLNNSYDDYQYDSCVSRGICSISPRNSALQTVLVLYLRLFAKYASELDDINSIDKETKNFILNTISITLYNPDFNDREYYFAVEKFKEVLPNIIEKFYKNNPESKMEEEKTKAYEMYLGTIDIIQAIKYGEKIFMRAQEQIPAEIRDLYNIMLIIAKSISIDLLDLESFDKNSKDGFKTILQLLSKINLEEKDENILKKEIYNSARISNQIVKQIRLAQEERYGMQSTSNVSYSTTPSKAVLVVGTNIRELETILENLKNEPIDIYTHDDMMLAHTFPKFSQYEHLKGQFGHGLENCLLDFATFPGPIILTKHSLHNIENFYRGRLFTTDDISPKGVIKIDNNDFSEVINSAKIAKGFKTGKQCETVTIGYDYQNVTSEIQNRISENKYTKIIVIGSDGFSLEQKTYFEKLIRLTPKDVLIISFSYNSEQENLLHINSCFDNYSLINIYEFIKNFSLPIHIFIPKCERNSVAEMIYLSENENTQIYVGKCTPIIINPSLMNTLQKLFNIKNTTSAKKDLKELLNQN